ncbi:putative WRKY transcription factor 70 isoform X2 [Panicum miliaceum]|uniref:WRKY transcription factor 70 isoform X2 n=1 Tax=Panicum miliaceum TaxID=4540 RepID=A0A3L6TKJ1_PANMI|nr:putative WRKY transcription factor 70 isoform X2 [Panicum miliaceum]
MSTTLPAERAAAAANDLVEARDGAATLRTFLLQLDDRRAPWAQGVVDGVLSRLSSAMSALDVGGAAAEGGQSPAAGSGSGGASRPQQSASSSGNTKKRSFSRRSQRPSDTKITDTLEDGHVWRKYGQKEIQNSSYPRSYYRCTHSSGQGCNAKRQVQSSETDPSKYVVTYYGEHTCRDPSTIPVVVHDAGAAAPDRASNLISFGPNGASNNAAASAGAYSSSQYLAMGGSTTADQLSTSWCTSDDMFSSSAGSFMQVEELIGAVVGTAGVTSTAMAGSSALDRGGLGGMASSGGGNASFPPSPNGLSRFVVGSLGSIGGDDDDLFSMEP